jgi:HK97 family phage portal protein
MWPFRRRANAAPRAAISQQDLLAAIAGAGDVASGAVVTSATAFNASAVFACISLLSRTIAALPVGVYRRSGATRVELYDHPVAAALRRPNGWQTRFEFVQMLAGHVALRGNAFAMKAGAAGRVSGFVPMHPDRVAVKQNDDTTLTYTYTLPNGTRREFDQSAVMHWRGLTTDGVMGLSPVRCMREAIGLALRTEEHGARLFKNGAQIGGLLKHPGVISDTAAKKLKQSFDERHAGAENAHRTILIEEGMDWVKVGMTAEDSQFLETRRFQASEIARFFLIPPHMIGETDKTTSWGSGVEQLGIGFITYTLMPWLVAIEQAIERDCLSDADIRSGVYLRFNVSALLRSDAKSRAEALQIQRRNGVINANEWRAIEDMNPRTDEGGDDYIVESNMTTGQTNDAAPQAVV